MGAFVVLWQSQPHGNDLGYHAVLQVSWHPSRHSLDTDGGYAGADGWAHPRWHRRPWSFLTGFPQRSQVIIASRT